MIIVLLVVLAQPSFSTGTGTKPKYDHVYSNSVNYGNSTGKNVDSYTTMYWNILSELGMGHSLYALNSTFISFR